MRIMRIRIRSSVVSPVARPLVAPRTAGCSVAAGAVIVSGVLVAPRTAGVAAAGVGVGTMIVVVVVVVVVPPPPAAALIVSVPSAVVIR